MLQVLSILLGAAFTVGTAMALGSLLLNRLRLTLYRQEAILLSFVGGSALLSLAIFFLCLVNQARRNVFLLGGLAAIVWAWRQARSEARPKAFPDAPKIWHVSFLVLVGAFFFIYFFNALAPETSPDGSGYHLGNVLRIWQHHGFVWTYHSMYSYLSQGMEMLFLVAFSIGRHSAASLVHFAFQLTLPLLIAAYGRRFGFPVAGFFAAILVYVSPVVGKAGASAYNDLAVATLLFAVFYLLEIWDENQEVNLLIFIGLLAGFAYAVKYTGALALPFVWGRLLLRRRDAGQHIGTWRQLAIVTAAAAVMILPWVLRNWIWLGNPAAPFFNAWFPNPYYHPGMERIYLDDLRHYVGIRHWWQGPWQITAAGRSTQGMIGPIFLLVPMAVLALRHLRGRRLILAGLVFAIPAYFNSGARFLIPMLPFLSLALGLALPAFRGVLPILALCEALACWPQVLSHYCDPANWHLGSIPVAAALRLTPEPVYLKDHLPDYTLKAALETFVAPQAKIFSLNTRTEAYLNRTFVVGYESAFGNLAQDLFAVAYDPQNQPAVRRRLRFLPVITRAVRVVQIASASSFWRAAEMRVYARGKELARSPEWRLSAWPNSWEVQLAFDNSYATRWSSWQAMAPGMFLAIDFGRPREIDEVNLEEPRAPESKVQVEVLDSRARWVPLTDTAEISPLDIPQGLRRAVTRELKARGIGYLWVEDADFFADDLRKNASYWSVTDLKAARGMHLYILN